MYLRNYRMQKMSLVKCLKSPVSEHLRQWTWKRVPNTAEMCIMALLSYFLSFWPKFSMKLSLFMISEILGLLLAHRLPITSIFLVIVRVFLNQFKWNYLKSKKFVWIRCFKNDLHTVFIYEITECKRCR